MRSNDPFRKAGQIESVKHYFEDHVGQWTNYVFVKYDDFGTQGFGGYALGREEGEFEQAYVRELCATFGVKKLDELVGKRCVALFEEKGWNAFSRGLECEKTGKRFTIRGFLKRNLKGYRDETAYEKNVQDLEKTIRRNEDTLERLKRERDSMTSADFRDWND